MKYCPSCRITYADESLRFCLQDGTGLLDYPESSLMPTQDYSEKETVVRQKPLTTDWQPRRTTPETVVQPEAKKNNAPLMVSLAALVLCIIFGGLIFGWLLLGGSIFGWQLSDGGSGNKNSSNGSANNTSSRNTTLANTGRNDNSRTNSNTDNLGIWEPIDYNASLNGERMTYYPGTTVEACQSDCEDHPRCKAFGLVRAGFYNPQDPPMCYLLSKVTSSTPSSCCISGIKK